MVNRFTLLLLLVTLFVGATRAGTKTLSPSAVSGDCGDIALNVVGSGVDAVIDSMDMGDHCENDVQGPNDEPGQKDLNRYCARVGPNNSSFFYWSWDEILWSGSNTGDACILLDSNKNGLADLAICVSVEGNGVFQQMRLFRCTGDQATDRCFGSEELVAPAEGFKTHCCVESNSPVDPFYDPSNSKNTGDQYPLDTLARCQVFLADFQIPNIAFVDVCSYPSLQPNSDPSDCVLTRFCKVDSDCPPRNDKNNGCWRTYCDANLGVCRSEPLSVGTLCEVSGSESFCDGKATCDGTGVCNPGSPLDCSSHTCGTICQEPVCVEPSTFTVATDASCGCAANVTATVCTSECGGSSECRSGTCNAGVCGCSNLSGSCNSPTCDDQCQTPMCSVGNCVCGNLPSTTLCEVGTPDFCDGKSVCKNGACVTQPPPNCSSPCSTWCQKEVCQNPATFDSTTSATCVCQAAPERAGDACEPDSITCTQDICDNSGSCVHHPGQCTGCAVACLNGTCTPNPTIDQQPYVWDDGCIYQLSSLDGDQLDILPPEGGTSNAFCVETSQSVKKLAQMVSGQQPNDPIRAASIAMLTIGLVALVAALGVVAAFLVQRRRAAANDGVAMV